MRYTFSKFATSVNMLAFFGVIVPSGYLQVDKLQAPES